MLERILLLHDVFIYCLQSCLLQNLRGSRRVYPFVFLVLSLIRINVCVCQGF
jgi:hypothetical protein